MAAIDRRATHQRLIRDVPLLARLEDCDLDALAASGREHSYEPGAVIFREGDAGDALYVVMDGRVRISILSSEGTEATFGFIETGDCFGDLAIIDGGPRTATATAAVPTTTFVVTRPDFMAWLSARPGAGVALLETLARRLRRTDQALADLSFLDLSHRLAKQLLALAGRSDGQTPHRVHITQAELGSMLSVSRESVNKQLNLFQRQGWIALSRGCVVIHDMAALRTLV